MSSKSKLMQEATKFLRKNGYRWDGRQQKKVDGLQVAFEKRMRPNPFSGRSTRG